LWGRGPTVNRRGDRLRVAIVGCGQIADAHLGELRRVSCAELVATCDIHRDLAEPAAARYGVPNAFDSVPDMLAHAHPDVVHITTPPQTHKELTLAALAAGAHVYVEKPFALNRAEAQVMLAAARTYGRKICVGHDQLFDPLWLECRRRHDAGEFGEILHIDSVMGYNLAGPFGSIVSADPQHWVHRLPGGLFQNNISHALCRITEYLPDRHPGVWAHWFTPGGHTFPSELRVMLRGRHATASVLFSSRVRPVQRVAWLHGTRAVVEVNLDAGTLRVDKPSTTRGPFIKLQLSWWQLMEARRAVTQNIRGFLHSELQYFAGMRLLFERFYDSILVNGPEPILPGEILRVAAIMDDVFEACGTADVESSAAHALPAAAQPRGGVM